jgi:DNA gyrase subunit B/topoisomerase-4 subunit B
MSERMISGPSETIMAAASNYTAADITILDGLEPVRLRPGMYIGDTGKAGLHHLLWEIVDNAVDEAINGHATTIEVTLHEDGCSASVGDNGRGIPIDIHPKEGKPALEVILTKLHSGGKFNHDNYATSGGLHGVGSSVVNALSVELVAKIRRGGKLYQQRYSRGVPQTALEVVGEAKGTGTEIFFRPDPTIFEDTEFDAALIAERLETKSFLNRGLRIVFRDRVRDKYYEFRHDGGVRDFLDHIIKLGKQPPVHLDPVVIQHEDTSSQEVTRVEIALSWTESTAEELRTFVNGVHTGDGGTHEQGLRDGLSKAIRSYFEAHNLTPKGVQIQPEDIREGVKAVVSVFVRDPQFQGQTKNRLNNPGVKSHIARLVHERVEQYLHSHSSAGAVIAQRIIQSARARLASRSAAKQVTRKRAVAHRLNLPGKLADCSAQDPEICELFIVEGDSAGGNAKQGRDRRTQAILPLRGKVLNTEQASTAKVLSNKELRDVVDALGCGADGDFDESRLRYHKIILLMDADSDGHHISTLLLTFFFRYMPQLIEQGRLFIAQPPLYRIDWGMETHWALDDQERDKIVSKLNRRKQTKKLSIQRFKGLGEMMADTLKETTLDPARRRLLKVVVREEDRAVTEDVIGTLMGKDASLRFDLIMQNAKLLDELDV